MTYGWPVVRIQPKAPAQVVALVCFEERPNPFDALVGGAIGVLLPSALGGVVDDRVSQSEAVRRIPNTLQIAHELLLLRR
eukprot:CAMPEP_0198227686 /NCGR_PEP_ID=MMETSP1445-20131203/110210_1 /TAXON_ID=36898 /ORGANISM="Pyramimonas sp., Strain CCMP2087" /LENGTH=79 /DNA_ID=CAMNT_0043907829 /DNA_START=328 /DNA_END=567 /DNA_ORIENTATION=+